MIPRDPLQRRAAADERPCRHDQRKFDDSRAAHKDAMQRIFCRGLLLAYDISFYFSRDQASHQGREFLRTNLLTHGLAQCGFSSSLNA